MIRAFYCLFKKQMQKTISLMEVVLGEMFAVQPNSDEWLLYLGRGGFLNLIFKCNYSVGLFFPSLLQELPQAVSEILGIESSSVTPDSDTGEDESATVLSCPTSLYQSISTPVTAANGTRESTQQMSDTQTLTPA